MGADTRSCASFVAYRSYADRHRHEKAFDGVCRPIQSKRLGVSQPTASQSVKRDEKIVKEKELKMMESPMSIYQYPSPRSTACHQQIGQTVSGFFGDSLGVTDVSSPNLIASYSVNGAIHTFV